MYNEGSGVSKDDRKAAMWYLKAAEGGHLKAQYYFAVKCGKGSGVPKDYARSYAWLNIASAGGSKDATKLLDSMQARMTREQIADAQKLSREIWERIEANKRKAEEAASE